MKCPCPICNGKGYVYNALGDFNEDCGHCQGSGTVIVEPQTNEDWLHTLTTERLADVFFDYRYINATPQQQLWLSANEDFVKGGIVEWLKQPHISKE